jgi:Putative zinc ribbon domain
MKSCESCGMPMDGKNVSSYNNKYCLYCMDEKTGFLKPEKDVRKSSIEAAIKFMGKTREEAEKFVDGMMAKLPRWHKK